MSEKRTIEWFLRLSLSAGYFSDVADRFGVWPKRMSTWGNWNNFIDYTHTLMPFLTREMANIAGLVATLIEIFLAVLLLTNYRTSIFSRISGCLLLTFGICMAVFINIKAPLDYSVFIAAAASFALAALHRR